MTCTACEEAQEKGEIAYYRVNTANVGLVGCRFHVRIIMEIQGRQNDKAAAVRLTVQGAGTDAQTSVLCKGFYVYGMQHSQLSG